MSAQGYHGDEREGACAAWTEDAVRRLGMTTDLATAASIIGIGRTLAFELAKADEFPVRLVRLRRRVLVPIPDLLRFLGVDDTE